MSTMSRTLASAALIAGAFAYTEQTLSHADHDDTLVYLPDNYDPANNHPVLYFLHGRGQEEAGPSNGILPGKPGLRFEQSLDDVPFWSFGALTGLKLTNLIDERGYVLVAPLANRVDPDPTCVDGSCRSWNSDSINRFRANIQFEPFPSFTTNWEPETCEEKQVPCADDDATIAAVFGAATAGQVDTCAKAAPTLLSGALTQGLPVDCQTDLTQLTGGLSVTLSDFCPVTCGTCPEKFCSNDEEFLVDLVATVQETYNTNPYKTHISGFSSGSFMAYQMVCKHAELFASAFNFGGPQDLSGFATCEPTEPVSIAHVHATFDATVPFDTAIPTFLTNTAVNGCEEASLAAPVAQLDIWTDIPVGTVAGIKAQFGIPDGTPLDFYDDVTLQFQFSALPGIDTTVFEATGCPEGITQELWIINGANHLPRINDNFPEEAFNFLDSNEKPYVGRYEQCGGVVGRGKNTAAYSGPTRCELGFECVEYSEFYSQCQPQ